MRPPKNPPPKLALPAEKKTSGPSPKLPAEKKKSTEKKKHNNRHQRAGKRPRSEESSGDDDSQDSNYQASEQECEEEEDDLDVSLRRLKMQKHRRLKTPSSKKKIKKSDGEKETIDPEQIRSEGRVLLVRDEKYGNQGCMVQLRHNLLVDDILCPQNEAATEVQELVSKELSVTKTRIAAKKKRAAKKKAEQQDAEREDKRQNQDLNDFPNIDMEV